MDEYLRKTEEEMRLRNYSPKTRISYLRCLRSYFVYKGSDWARPDTQSIRNFLLSQQEKGSAPQTINLYLNAIKFFYRDIVGVHERLDIKFSKRSKKLPVVLSRDEIISIVKSLKNVKHKLLMALAYGAGLRVSEATNLNFARPLSRSAL